MRMTTHYWATSWYAKLAKKYAHSTDSLLDVGCGDGRLVEKCASDFGVCIGVDKHIDEEDFERVIKGIYRRKGAFLAMIDVEKIQITRRFTCIIAKYVLEHIADTHGTLCKLYNTLADNGVMIVSVPHTNNWGHRQKGAGWYGYNDPTHITMQPYGWWRWQIHAAGFKIVDEFGDGLWDVPYYRRLPTWLQWLWFGLPMAWRTIWGLRGTSNIDRSECVIFVLEKRAVGGD